MSVVSIENLTYYYDPSKPALQNLSLELPKGSRVLLIGANGAGKSTLLQVLAGKRMTPKGTKVTIKGQDVFRNTSEACRNQFNLVADLANLDSARSRVLHSSVLNGEEEGRSDLSNALASLVPLKGYESRCSIRHRRICVSGFRWGI